MQTADVTVRVKALDGTWGTLGADRQRRIAVENPEWSHNSWGPDKASFDLRRDPKAIFPDLRAFTPVRIELGDELAWGGRIIDTPVTDAQDRVLNVQCEGWQYHLDDDVYQRTYVHSKLTDFVDVRSLLTADLTTMHPYGVVSNQGAISLTFPAGTAISGQVGVVLDLGQSDAKRVIATVQTSNNTGNVSVFVIGTDVPWWNDSSRLDYGSSAINAGAALTIGGTITAAKRYVTLLLNVNTSFTPATDVWVKFTSCLVFRDPAYESGFASILTADTIVKDALTFCPLLSTDTSQIQTASFAMKDFPMDAYHTPREVIDAANAVQNWITQVDELGRMVFKPRPTSPVVEVGAWSGMDFQDASANSGESIYNRVITEGAGPDGVQIAVERTSGQQAGAVLQPLSAITPNNPSFDTNTTSWTAAAGSAITRDTTIFDTSPASGRWDNGAGGNLPTGATLVETFTGTFRKGRTYVFALRARINTAGTGIAVNINASLGTAGDQSTTPASLQSTTWGTVIVVWTPMADRSGVTLMLTATLGSGAFVYIDGLSLTQLATTLPDRFGFKKAYILQCAFTLDNALGQQLGDLFLANHKTTPFKGSINLTGQRSIRDARTGAGIHPGHLGRRAMQLMRFSDRIDPDTGGRGRNGTLATVSYKHTDQVAGASIDDTRSNFEALLARMAQVQGAGQ